MSVAHLRRLTVADNRVYALVLVGLAFAYMLTHAPDVVLTADEAQWMTTVDKVLRGRALVRDAVMAKGPYLTLWHTLAKVGMGRSVVALHLAAALWSLLTGVVVMWFAGRAWGRGAATWSGFVFLCAMSHHGAHKGAYSEVLMVLPTALAMLCLLIGVTQRRPWLALLAGVLGAAATLTKQVGAFDVMASYAALVALVTMGHLSRREGAGLGVWYTAGGVVGCLPFVLYLMGHGILGEYLRGSALEPAGYISVVGVGDTVRNLLGAVTAVIAPNAMVFIAGLGGLLLLWPAALRRNGSSDADARTSVSGAAAVIACCWCVGAVVGIAFVRRFSVGHFVQFYPPASVLGGVLLWRLLATEGAGRAAARAAACSLVLFGLLLASVPVAVGVGAWRRAPQSWREASPMREIGEYVAERTDAADTAFVWGDQNEILYWAGRELGADAPWATTIALGFKHAAYAGTPRMRESVDWAWVREQLDKWRPAYVIVAPRIDIIESQYAEAFTYEKLPELQGLLEAAYVLETTIDGYRLFRRSPAQD